MAIKLRDHQNRGVRFIQMCAYLGALLWHEMGTGKTITTLAYVRIKLAELRMKGVANPKFIIILPKSAITTWQAECQSYAPDIFRDMLLLPYSQINKAPKLMLYYDIRIIVFDESHYLKSPSTNRAQDLALMFEGLAKSKGEFKDGKIVMLSGTPMMNHAGELYTTWAILSSPDCVEAAKRLLDADRYDKWTKTFSQQKEKKWKTKYAEKRANTCEGVANAEMLQELLNPIVDYVRSEDCIDLPEKQEMHIDLKLADDKLLADANIEEPEAYMALLERLARAKTPYALEWIKDFLSGSQEQLIVFASYKFPIQEIRDKFPSQVVLVTGEETGGERKANIEAFQQGKKRIIAMTFRAGSESLNLQNAHTSLYLGFPWNDTGIRQAMARSHRQGQKNFTLHYFMFSGFNDIRILNLVRAKGEAVSTVEAEMIKGKDLEIEYTLDSFI